MTPKLRLLALVCLAPLAACATTPVAPVAEAPAPAPVEVAQPELPPIPDNSPAGLYLAGNAAARDGRNAEAADYYARAAALVDADGQPYLRERAFLAAVNAGAIPQAAGLAPQPGEGSQATQRLGKLVVAVDALAKGDGAASYAILRTDEVAGPYRNAALLLRPWAGIMAGEENPVGQPRAGDRDRMSQAFSQANRALALEFAKRNDEAEAAYQGLESSGVSMRAFELAHGAFLERQGRKAEAVAIYDRMLAEQASDRAASLARARAANRRSAPPALPTPQEAAAQALMMAASGAMAQGSTDTALIYVQLATRLDPDRPDAILMSAAFAEQAGDLERARATYARVPADAPEFIDARLRMVATWRMQDNLPKAVEAAKETARLAPNDQNVQLELADLLRATEDYDGAVKILTKLINTRGREPDWRLHYARAISLENGGRWAEAEKDLLRALEIDPNQPEIMNYLGYTWADRGENLPQALELLQKAVRAQPNSGAIVDSVGWAYFRMGDIGKAIENLERAVELSPSDPDINDHLGDAYAKSDSRRLEALFQWERVLTLQPDAELRTRVQGKIAQAQRALNIANAEPAPVLP